jgi:cytochrome c2
MRRSPFALTLAAIVGGIGFFAIPNDASADGDVQAGATVFNRCSACHQVGPGARNAVGPHLNGVMGRAVAGLPDFDYSNGLAARRGEFWNPELVASYIADPARFIGERSAMPAQRLRPSQVDDLLAYLESQ